MTNATKTLSVLFAGTVALALVASFSWSSSSSAAFQEQLLAVDTSQVQGVRIERSGGSTVHLRKTSSGWSVSSADTTASFPARAQDVNRLLSTLPSLQVSAVATRQPDKHARYGVDSTGLRVTLLGESEEPVGALVVGRAQMRQPQSAAQKKRRLQRRPGGTMITYVRPPDQPDVYSVEQPLRSALDQSTSAWRKRRLWSVSRSQIQRVEFEYPADSSYTLERAAPADTGQTASAAWLSRSDTLSTTSVNSLLRNLAAPQADGFVEGTSPDAFGTAQYTIRLHLIDGSQRTLRLRPSDSGDTYTAVADRFPYVVQLEKGRWDRSILKARSELLPER